MAESCFASSEPLDQSDAVDARHSSSFHEREACLCTPSGLHPALLQLIPDAEVERDYGCGDPTRWVRPGDRVLDLGSGSGKNAFICSQLVGADGSVLGVDRNPYMLSLSRQDAPAMADAIGYGNVRFVEGAIEALDEQDDGAGKLVPDASIKIVLSKCVLTLVNPSSHQRLLANIRLVMAQGVGVGIGNIVSDKPVPMHLQQDPDLWSGCISGAWQEDEFIEDFCQLGLEQVSLADRSEQPRKTLEGTEFRAVTLVGQLPG